MFELMPSSHSSEWHKRWLYDMKYVGHIGGQHTVGSGYRWVRRTQITMKIPFLQIRGTSDLIYATEHKTLTSQRTNLVVLTRWRYITDGVMSPYSHMKTHTELGDATRGPTVWQQLCSCAATRWRHNIRTSPPSTQVNRCCVLPKECIQSWLICCE